MFIGTYTIRGDIFINIYPEYMEIVNPGRLPLGITVENILHSTKKRNEHMAGIFLCFAPDGAGRFWM
ncbi:MAG: ATP-binding protein [Segatella copri]